MSSSGTNLVTQKASDRRSVHRDEHARGSEGRFHSKFNKHGEIFMFALQIHIQTNVTDAA